MFLITLACAAPAQAQQAAPFPVSRVAMRGTRLADFVPAGWQVEGSVRGDLNGDGRPDQVARLVPKVAERDPLGYSPDSTALLIVLAGRGGELRRGGLATGLLVPGVPQSEVRLTIRNGVLNVWQRYGFSTVWEFTHRFRLDARRGSFRLIGRDRMTMDRGGEDGEQWEERSDNYLTGVRITTLSRWDGRRTRATTRREAIPRRRTRFEHAR